MAIPQHSPTLNLFGVLSETQRIINAHSRHFLALSVFFLLPLSFSLTVYPILKAAVSHPNSFGPFISPHQSLFLSLSETVKGSPRASILFHLIYALLFFIVYFSAVGTITYSTYHGFYGRPVKLVSSIKSLFRNYPYLLVAMVLTGLSKLAIVFGPTSLTLCTFDFLQRLGWEKFSLGSKYFMGFMIFVGIIIALNLVYLEVAWMLVNVIVVSDPKRGIEPLTKSSDLIKGMRMVAVSMIFLYGFAICFLVWASSVSVTNATESNGWCTLAFVVLTVVCSGLVTLLMLHNLASIVVLYMYCKAFHGELAFEIAEEFAHHYVSLPFDHEKVPHIVSAAEV